MTGEKRSPNKQSEVTMVIPNGEGKNRPVQKEIRAQSHIPTYRYQVTRRATSPE